MTRLRSLLFNAWFFGLTTVMSAYGVVFCHRRDRVVALARRWAVLVLWGARVLCGIRVKITGAALVPAGGPALIAGQHQSALDIFLWLVLLPRPCFVLKQDLTRLPLFGVLARRAEMIAVDRSGGAAALRRLMQAAAQASAQDRQLVIFPEGTRAAPGEPSHLHPGVAAMASSTGLAVIAARTNSGSLWGRRAFSKRAGVAELAIGPVLPPGLRRSALMAALADAFTSVENSVGGASAELPREASTAA